MSIQIYFPQDNKQLLESQLNELSYLRVKDPESAESIEKKIKSVITPSFEPGLFFAIIYAQIPRDYVKRFILIPNLKGLHNNREDIIYWQKGSLSLLSLYFFWPVYLKEEKDITNFFYFYNKGFKDYVDPVEINKRIFIGPMFYQQLKRKNISQDEAGVYHSIKKEPHFKIELADLIDLFFINNGFLKK